mmetsp:Transcript_8106/g.8297  ORF Transcript_8106/g.8297 Transcript_8106/m.8297 type:complete len:96 (-) Transcript_8106:37-324(-)
MMHEGGQGYEMTVVRVVVRCNKIVRPRVGTGHGKLVGEMTDIALCSFVVFLGCVRSAFSDLIISVGSALSNLIIRVGSALAVQVQGGQVGRGGNG